MQIPNYIKIGGLTFDVKKDNTLSRERHKYGESSAAGLWITYDPSFPKEQIESTFLHEIIEMINDVYELELEHHKITLLETTLYQIMKDNPDIFKEGD
jgi:hypothetical protein